MIIGSLSLRERARVRVGFCRSGARAAIPSMPSFQRKLESRL
jgi:hypothetical protein